MLVDFIKMQLCSFKSILPTLDYYSLPHPCNAGRDVIWQGGRDGVSRLLETTS